MCRSASGGSGGGGEPGGGIRAAHGGADDAEPAAEDEIAGAVGRGGQRAPDDVGPDDATAGVDNRWTLNQPAQLHHLPGRAETHGPPVPAPNTCSPHGRGDGARAADGAERKT